MKKIVLSISIMSVLCSFNVLLADSCAVSSKTFFMPRSMTSDLGLLHAGAHQFIFTHEPAPRFFLNCTAFYQASTNNRDLARYFLPADKSELVVKGALAEGDRDISGTWLQVAGKNSNAGGNNVPTELGFPDPTPTGNLDGNTTRGDIELYLNEFFSKISMNPTLKSFGVLLQSHHNLDCLAQRFWCSFDFPVMQVETNVHLCETDVQNAATTRGNIDDFIITNADGDVTRHERARMMDSLNAAEGFDNQLWKYGRINNATHKLAGLADIQFKLGYNAVRLKAFRLNLYGRALLPTTCKPKATYMFEPILGSAGHWGFGAGSCIDVSLASGSKFNLAFGANFDYLYLLSTTERRSMDLTANGDWSRYLLVLDTKNEPDPTGARRTLQPGINFFTRSVEVRPHHDVNVAGSLKMGVGCFFLEGGYNLWVKSAEDVCLKDQLPEGLAIAATHFGGRDADTPFEIRTFSKAQINSHIASPASDATTPADATHTDESVSRPVTLTSADLNVCSAAHPKRIAHKIFMNMGMHTMWRDNPVQLGFGASYEFANKNRSLDLWGIFLKLNLFV